MRKVSKEHIQERIAECGSMSQNKLTASFSRPMMIRQFDDKSNCLITIVATDDLVDEVLGVMFVFEMCEPVIAQFAIVI